MNNGPDEDEDEDEDVSDNIEWGLPIDIDDDEIPEYEGQEKLFF